MHALLTYIVLLLSLLMFVVKREHKICILLIYLLCLNGVYAPTLKGVLLPQVFFFLSEIRYFKQYVNIIKGTRFKYPLVILLVGIVILWINSPHMTGPSGLFALFSYDFIRKYGIFFFVFIACLGCKNQKAIIKVTFIYLLVLTSFGILNLLTKHAIYVDWVLAGLDADSVMGDAGSKFTYEDRFRVQAMFANPFDYGYFCLTLLLYYWYLLKGKLIKKNLFYVASICCLFGIFTCGCRTILACSIVGFLIFVLFGYNLKSKLKLSLASLFLIFTVTLMMPDNVNKQINFLTSAFTDDPNVGGSSLSMRQTQTAAVMYYIQDNMAFGRGYGFFVNDLGFGGGRSEIVDKDLCGLEGVYMSLLLERGIVGLVLYVLFWLSIIWITLNIAKKTKDRRTLAICLSVIASYLAFANMTGELSSVPITLSIIGLCLAWSLRESNISLNQK